MIIANTTCSEEQGPGCHGLGQVKGIRARRVQGVRCICTSALLFGGRFHNVPRQNEPKGKSRGYHDSNVEVNRQLRM